MKKQITNSIVILIGGLFLLFGVYLSYMSKWAYLLILVGATIFGYELYRLMK
jgi:hypothetical protein